MKRSEFMEKSEIYEKSFNRRMLAFIVATVIGFAVMIWSAFYFDQETQQTVFASTVWIICVISYFLILSAFLFRLHIRGVNFYGLRCEKCRGWLTGVYRKHALNTNCCHHCGQRVLEDD